MVWFGVLLLRMSLNILIQVGYGDILLLALLPVLLSKMYLLHLRTVLLSVLLLLLRGGKRKSLSGSYARGFGPRRTCISVFVCVCVSVCVRVCSCSPGSLMGGDIFTNLFLADKAYIITRSECN